jgi:hypothetical protein
MLNDGLGMSGLGWGLGIGKNPLYSPLEKQVCCQVIFFISVFLSFSLKKLTSLKTLL